MRFRTQDSVLNGLTPTQLTAFLAQAQAAYINLQTGGLAETLSYASGDGTKQVTYTRANMSTLANLIAEIQTMLGLRRSPRRSIGVYF